MHGVKFVFAPEMEVIVRVFMNGLATHPILVFPEWDAVADDFRHFRLYCNASIDGFSAILDQDPLGASIRHIVFINHITYHNARGWTPLGLQAGSIDCAIKRLRGHLCSTKFLIYFDDKALEKNTKAGEHNAHVQRGFEVPPTHSYTLEYRKGWFNGNADFLSRLSQPATDLDCTGPNYLISTDTVYTHLIQAFCFTAIVPFTPGFVLGGFIPPASSCFNPIPPFPGTKNDFGVYRRHGSRMDTSDSA